MTSHGVTIDTTPPEVIDQIDTGSQQYVSESGHMAVNFQGVFRDAESGKSIDNEIIPLN